MKLLDSNLLMREKQLSTGIEAIDWYMANLLSESLALDEKSRTIWRSVLIMLSIAQRHGHTCLDLMSIAGKPAYNFDNHDEQWHLPAINELKQISIQACAQLSGDVVLLEDTRLYTRRYWAFEQELAIAISQRQCLQRISSEQYDELIRIWPLLFPNQSQTEDWQQVATAASLILPFCIINGGPGTGKTYTVARILFALQCIGEGKLNIQLTAPTGKAAQRLGESISQSIEVMQTTSIAELSRRIPTTAMTLHRLLGIRPYEVRTRKNQNNRLDCDVLIVDEASMVDLALMVRLVRSLKPECKLILVGDADQLPAIESGNVLEALVGDQLSTNQLNTVMTEHITRLNSKLTLTGRQVDQQPFTFTLQRSQRFGGDLAVLAKCIQSGEHKDAWQQLIRADVEQPTNVFAKHPVSRISPEAFLNQLTWFIEQSFQPLFAATSAAEALSAAQFCRWLTPIKKGPFGVERLNQQAEIIGRQKAMRLNPRTIAHTSRFYSGQPVMVLENNYTNRLYNGDVGVVWPDQMGRLKAWFETENNTLRAVSLTRLPVVQTAYAMTVHKSQGSEFSHVVMMLPRAASEQQLSLNCRELLYTGLTRAKQTCLFVCEQDVFIQTVQTRQQRFSGLSEKIKKFGKTKEIA